jgi:hypothetical protein
LDEVLALLGATADSFAAASALLAKLTLVHICPNVVRAATETLGQVLQAEEQRVVQAAWAQGTVPPTVATPPQLYLSMDGVLVHTEAQWREYKLGSVYTTTTRPSATHPGREEVCAHEVSYVGDVAEAADFGQLLWCEAARRGVLTAREVIVLADGAHWIWNLADEHFPEATQIVDWYHASHYVWQAAHAIYGDGTPLAKRWAKRPSTPPCRRRAPITPTISGACVMPTTGRAGSRSGVAPWKVAASRSPPLGSSRPG